MNEQPLDHLTDDEIRTRFGMTPGETGRGFDLATQAKVFADGFIRSRGRFAHQRALYAAFVDGGSRFMIENLDEQGDGHGEPAKLLFVDEAPDLEAADNPMAMTWTERALLDALVEERAIQDFFADLLEELAPALAAD